MTTRLLRSLIALLLIALAEAAPAHETTMAEMTLRELPGSRFVWSWGVPAAGRPIESELTVQWPPGCEVTGDRLLQCGPQGLSGRIAVDGLGRSYSAAILNLQWRDGAQRAVTLTPRAPEARVWGGTEDSRDRWDVVRTYTGLGLEHILSGWDHLLFVFSLLFLVGFERRLLGTITAFTVAHSLTLAASALGAVSLRPPPVEAAIALSILLVSLEALQRRDTAARRWPALVAFVFGLVHGLGFAGALAEIGLPPRHANLSLLSFNLGVEAGQLLVVALAWLLVVALRQRAWHARLRVPALYGIGSVAAYWTLTRVAAILA